ncbi:FUSC family protein [Nocardioides sp. MAHUQ-72]|uniref:FUSC family protein n=1 Tax=unclassified Nocardioides TaxID=2615069 RepID=UPI003618247F
MSVSGPRPEGARGKLSDPVFWTDVLQIVKTVVAGVIAWLIATEWLELPQSFLAPWSALLVVHATVYRTFSQGARQVGAAVAGVLLAWAVGNVVGLDPLAVGVVLLLGLSVGAHRIFEGQGTTVAATALVVLTTGFSTNDHMLVSRLLDTAIGIVVGLVVTAAVWPPLRRHTAAVALEALDDKIGELLIEMGDDLEAGVARTDVEGWDKRARDLDDELDRAWALVRQAKESARLNPRRQAVPMRDPKQWFSMLERLEQALADTRSMARTQSHSLHDEQQWQPEFRTALVETLRTGGHAIIESDRDTLRRCREHLDEIVELVGVESPISPLWPVYGGLIINLRNIFDALDEVAGSAPISRQPVELRLHR